MLHLRILMLACLASSALAEEPAGREPDPAVIDTTFPSPDGSFAFRHSTDTDDEAFVQVYDTKSGKTVADLSEVVMLSSISNTRLLWSPDSKSFAANFRAGGRYEATAFYRWNGTEFTELESPEAALYEKIVEPARQRELKAAKEPADTDLRRIWDTWKTTKWSDNTTVEIEGESTAAYYRNDEPNDIAIGIRATVKFDEAGKAVIVKANEAVASD